MSHYQVLIIGSGPAGYTAAIYVSRSGIKPGVITGFQTGGQLTQTTEIENFPGFPKPILGAELMDRMSQQCLNLGTEFIVDQVKSIDFNTRPFKITTDGAKTFTADTVIIATGSSAKKSGIMGEDKFWGYGVSACATCDGFFYRGKDVAVIGGGNAAVIEALHLSHIANSVTLVHRRDELRAEKIMTERVLSNPKIHTEWDTIAEEIYGNEKPLGVTGIKLKNVKTNATKDLAVDGVFIAIGHQPNTSAFTDIDLDPIGYIRTKHPLSTETNIEGVFAAGDVIGPRYKQAITAAASGCEAALDAVAYINKNK